MPAEEVMTIAQASVEELRKLCVEREMLPVLSDADPEKAVATMRFNLIAQVAVKDFASEYNLRIGEQSMQVRFDAAPPPHTHTHTYAHHRAGLGVRTCTVRVYLCARAWGGSTCVLAQPIAVVIAHTNN